MGWMTCRRLRRGGARWLGVQYSGLSRTGRSARIGNQPGDAAALPQLRWWGRPEHAADDSSHDAVGRVQLSVEAAATSISPRRGARAADCFVARGNVRVTGGRVNQGDDEGPPISVDPGALMVASRNQNGVSYQRSTVRVARIIDGTSKTALVGEKYLNPDHYFGGAYTADDQCIFSGHDNDNNGYTASGSAANHPEQDRPGLNLPFHFGSPHVAGLNMAFCDGSVQEIGRAHV